MSQNITDKVGRAWAKLSEIKEGDLIELDGGFDCRAPGKARVFKNKDGALAFSCSEGGEGGHILSGQADDGEHLVGIYPVAS